MSLQIFSNLFFVFFCFTVTYVCKNAILQTKTQEWRFAAVKMKIEDARVAAMKPPLLGWLISAPPVPLHMTFWDAVLIIGWTLDNTVH